MFKENVIIVLQFSNLEAMLQLSHVTFIILQVVRNKAEEELQNEEEEEETYEVPRWVSDLISKLISCTVYYQS